MAALHGGQERNSVINDRGIQQDTSSPATLLQPPVLFDGEEGSEGGERESSFGSAYLRTMEEERLYERIRKRFKNGSLTQDDIDSCLATFKSYNGDEVIQLNKEQKSVLYTAFCGSKRRNVFYTGSGGVGKTVVTNAIIHFLQCAFDPFEFGKRVAVTASTGIAATHISGCTIHSATGIGVPLYEKDFGKLWKEKERWRNLEILIIDEISMLSGEFLVST